MSKDKESDIDILRHILKYIDEIDEAIKHFGKSYETFKKSSIFHNAVSMEIQQIGELSKNLSEEIKASHTNIPWSVIRGMRNLFAHNYHRMDLKQIWDTAVDDIPVLRKFCEDIVNQ